MPVRRCRTPLAICIAAAVAALVAAAVTSPAIALDPYFSSGAGKLAVRGYDTTSYFASGKPRAGDANHTVTWNGVIWRFARAEDAAAFKADPTAYAPQFGGYCTGGLAQRHVVEGKPGHWRIHGSKLYLFHTAAGARNFDRDPAGTIAKASAYWQTLDIKR